MMIEYHMHEQNAWEVAQCYYKIYDTSITKADSLLYNNAIESCVVFLVLSKYDNHVSDMMHRLKLLDEVKDNKLAINNLTLFTTIEIIAFPFDGINDLMEHKCFKKSFVENDTLTKFIFYLINHNSELI